MAEKKTKKVKTPKYLIDGVRELDVAYVGRRRRYVRAWREKNEIIVQLWARETPAGEPHGDWAMPAVLGVESAVAQAALQTGFPK